MDTERSLLKKVNSPFMIGFLFYIMGSIANITKNFQIRNISLARKNLFIIFISGFSKKFFSSAKILMINCEYRKIFTTTPQTNRSFLARNLLKNKQSSFLILFHVVPKLGSFSFLRMPIFSNPSICLNPAFFTQSSSLNRGLATIDTKTERFIFQTKFTSWHVPTKYISLINLFKYKGKEEDLH